MEKPSSKKIIAIDGHSSCGKSTVAKDLAKELNYIYIDTGAMYRSVTLYALNNNIITKEGINLESLESQLPEINVSFKFNREEKKNITFLNGENVEDKIRGLEVSQNVSAISAIGFVRKRLVELQQEMGKEKGIVMDGRDIGTVVFPDAELKIFMTASPEIRAQRRYDELTAKGDKVSYDDIFKNVVDRDHIDENRAESPLRKADDAKLVDNSNLSKDQQLIKIINYLK